MECMRWPILHVNQNGDGSNESKYYDTTWCVVCVSFSACRARARICVCCGENLCLGCMCGFVPKSGLDPVCAFDHFSQVVVGLV